MIVYLYDSIQFSWKEQATATHNHIDESQNHDTKQKGKKTKDPKTKKHNFCLTSFIWNSHFYVNL